MKYRECIVKLHVLDTFLFILFTIFSSTPGLVVRKCFACINHLQKSITTVIASDCMSSGSRDVLEKRCSRNFRNNLNFHNLKCSYNSPDNSDLFV